MNASFLPRRRTDVTVIEIGSEAVLYDPLPPAVHRLNAAALLVWQCCDGASDASAISADIAETFGEPLNPTRAVVEGVVAGFAHNGLLISANLPTRASVEDVVPATVFGAPAAGSAVRRLGPFAAVDARFTIECLDADLIADELQRALASLPVDTTGPDASPAVPITVWSDRDGWNLGTGGFQLTAPDESVLVDFALQQITRLALAGSRRYLALHASTCARDGRAVMLPARSNSGKSTLAAIMVEAGFDYLTDEASFLDLETGDVVAFPKPITLDPGSQGILPHLEPFGLTGQSPKWQIAPTSIRPHAVVPRAKLTHIVLPTHDVKGDNTLVALDAIDGVVALLAAAVNVADHADHLDSLVTLVASCTVHSLLHDGIDGPRAAIESLFGAAH